MPHFTRDWLLMTHTTDTVKLAFEVMVEEYDGDRQIYHQQISRSKSGAMLRVKGSAKRIFAAFVVLDFDATGTVEYDAVTYNKGTPANLLACFAVDDLKVKSFDDSAFWDGAIVSEWSPRVVYEYTGDNRITELVIEER
jgi:hypothetical protein